MPDKDIKLIEIGGRLRLIREELKISQKEFAKKLDISNSNLSLIESGHSKPRYELIYNITKKYNINIYYLLHGKGSMFIPDNIELTLPEEDSDQSVFLSNFLRLYKESPLVRFSMMSYFRKFVLDNDELIEKDVKEHLAKKDKF